MLVINNKEHMAEVKAFAEKIGMIKQLQDRLNYLDGYACRVDDGVNTATIDYGRTKCLLFTDFAPYSFAFTMQRSNANGDYEYWFNGGLIFHGPHDNGGDGGAPTFSVNLSPEHGWSIHT